MATTSHPLHFDIFPSAQILSDDERERLLQSPGFGRVFTDHMAVIEWSLDKGWHGARITARQPFALDPAASVLHYGQEIFEGLKAYRGESDEVLLFRPEQNARRFQRSAKRLAMPQLPEGDFIAAIEVLSPRLRGCCGLIRLGFPTLKEQAFICARSCLPVRVS